MPRPTDRLKLNRFSAGDSSWSHTDTVETVDELAIARGASNERPTEGIYADEFYFATDQNVLWRWDEADQAWEIAGGVGALEHARSAESGEALRLEEHPWIDVTAHGANGDGESDDTATIEDAIDAMHDECVLLFPPGTYCVNEELQIDGKRDVTVSGFGATLSCGSEGSIEFSNIDGSLDVEGLTLTNNFQDGNLFRVDGCEDVTIADMVFRDTGDESPDSSARNNAVNVSGADRDTDVARVESCRFENIGGRPIVVRDTADITIHGSAFKDWHQREGNDKWDDDDGCIDFYGPDINATVSDCTFILESSPLTERTCCVNSQGNEAVVITGNRAWFDAEDNVSGSDYEPVFVSIGTRGGVEGRSVIVSDNLVRVTGFLYDASKDRGTLNLRYANNTYRVEGEGEINRVYNLRSSGGSAKRESVSFIGDSIHANGSKAIGVVLNKECKAESVIINGMTIRDSDDIAILDHRRNDIDVLMIGNCHFQSNREDRPIIRFRQEDGPATRMVSNSYFESPAGMLDDRTGSDIEVITTGNVDRA